MNDFEKSDLNAYGKTDHYKSWGLLKKQMTNLLADSLKSKISYTFTNYLKRNNYSMYGRAAILYQKQEMAVFSWDVFYSEQWKDERAEAAKMSRQEIADNGGIRMVQKQVHGVLMKEKWMPECALCSDDFIHAAVLYLHRNAEDVLRSDNYLLRVFAYMDRRIGKRTLMRLRDEVTALPQWVQQFYRIRCEAEGILCHAADLKT